MLVQEVVVAMGMMLLQNTYLLTYSLYRQFDKNIIFSLENLIILNEQETE